MREYIDENISWMEILAWVPKWPKQNLYTADVLLTDALAAGCSICHHTGVLFLALKTGKQYIWRTCNYGNALMLTLAS